MNYDYAPEYDRCVAASPVGRAERLVHTRPMTTEIERWKRATGMPPPWLDYQNWRVEDERLSRKLEWFDDVMKAYKKTIKYRVEMVIFNRWWLNLWLGYLWCLLIGGGPSHSYMDNIVAARNERRRLRRKIK